MDYKFFLNSLKNILLNPVKAWETIHSENVPVRKLRNSYLFPLISLVALAAFLGSLLFTNSELQTVYSIFEGIKYFFMLYITVYFTAFIFKEITYPMDLGRDFNNSFKIILFAMTPFIICLILSNIFESLLFFNVLGLYGLYIFWAGTNKLLSPPGYKRMPMLIATTITLTGIYVITFLVLTMVTDRIYFAFFA